MDNAHAGHTPFIPRDCKCGKVRLRGERTYGWEGDGVFHTEHRCGVIVPKVGEVDTLLLQSGVEVDL